jgi:uncharacterized protein (DUF885 family)
VVSAVKRFLTFLVAFCITTTAQANSATDEAFQNLADEYLSELTSFSPVYATLIGDHSADGELDEVDAAGREETLVLLREYEAALEALDFDQLSRENQVDAALLLHNLEAGIWSTETLQEWAWNPLYYIQLSGSGIYGLLARDFAPLEQRLRSAASRLEQLPRFFEQARGELVPERVPKIHAETAVSQNQGLGSIIDNMILPHMDSIPADLQGRLAAAIETARDAIADHQAWLEEELLPRANGDFRIGAELYDTKLAFALNSPLSRKEIKARAELEYQNVRNQMYEVAKTVYLEKFPMTAFPDNPDEAYRQVIIRAALEEAYKALPPRDGIVEVARQQLEEATNFVIEHDIVTMPEEPVEVIIMPEFQRGVSLAYLDPPGPLDRDQPAFYAVAPLPEDWTEEQVESFLREYNLYSLQDLTIHEGVPGHYLQLALSNRYPSMLRSVLWSGPFVEGWAVYAERVMIEAGYQDNDPLQRLITLKWYLRAVTNAIIDSAIHVDGMTRDEAMKLMVEGGFQEEREAAGKWIRAQLTSAQLSTYFVGYQEHAEMRAAVEKEWGDEFTLRRYHDQALSYGSPPVKYVRALILGEPIPHQDD